MKNLLRVIPLILLSSFCTHFLPAQWLQTNGPYGGKVNCFTVSGTNLFAGTYGGVFLSTNNGTSWTAVNTGLNTSVLSLAVSGTNLFAGTSGGGVFHSTNNGTSWTAVNTGLTNTYVFALAISGANLFAGTSGGGVFLSTNNGTSWTQVNTGLTDTSVDALAVSGANLFAGTLGGVFLSANNGTNWTRVNTGLTNTSVWSLAVSGTNLFAGTYGGGVFLSTNNGTSWTQVNTDLTDISVFAFAVSGANLFAGTRYSGVWRRPLSEMIGGGAGSISPSAAAQVPAGVPFWVDVKVGDPNAVSDLYGVSFKLNSNQSTCTYVSGSAEAGSFLGTSPMAIFQAVDAQTVDMAVTKTSSPGANGNGVVARAQFTTPSSQGTNTNVLFSLTDVTAINSSGASISLSTGTVTVTFVSAAQVFPGDCDNNGTVSAADLLPIGLYYGQQNGTQPTPNNAGIQWQAFTRGYWANEPPGKKVYADADGTGIINTADLLPIGLNYGKTHQVTTNSVKEPVVAAGTMQKEAATELQIASVTREQSGDGQMHMRVVLRAETPVYGIAFTLKYNVGGSSENLVHHAALDTTRSVFGGGLMFNRASDEVGIWDLAITRTDGIDYNGTGLLLDLALDVPTGRESALQLEICNVTANDAAGNIVSIAGLLYPAVATGVDAQVPASFGLQQNYPNPFNPSTTIEVSVPEQAHLVMRVYDVLGRGIVTLLEGERAPGICRVSWDGKDAGGVPVRSGVYYCRLTAQGTSGKIFTQTRQMVVVK
ncbi:MAG: T9SS type A sorting domain-containing protein [Ignavibacteriales bacterium]|nr:T9SS type A sorting domain-containing protein [Ignavibacteriales bacterium]